MSSNKWSAFFILRNELSKIDRAKVEERRSLEKRLEDSSGLSIVKLRRIVDTVEKAVSELNGEEENDTATTRRH